MTIVEKQWHHRYWCPCGYNYEDELGTIKWVTTMHATCPDCGRTSNKWLLLKGRWKTVKDIGKRDNFEVWVDPDPGLLSWGKRFMEWLSKRKI